MVSVTRENLTSERGFTIIEVMLSIVLLTVGLLAVATVFQQGLAVTLYGKDQTKAAALAQQEIEFLKTQAPYSASCPATPLAQTATAALNCWVGTYGDGTVATATVSADGQQYARDVQVQYWVWDGTQGQFVVSGTPTQRPSSGQFVYRVSVATHWTVRGQTSFVSGSSSGPNGCVTAGAAAPVGLGCVEVSTFMLAQ